MQACVVKHAAQPNVWDNSMQSSIGYQIRHRQMAEIQLWLPEILWEERGRGGELHKSLWKKGILPSDQGYGAEGKQAEIVVHR